MTEIHGGRTQGFCAPGYERVQEAFERGFKDLGEVGAAAALYVDGHPVVDLWGGVAHPEREIDEQAAAWQRDTLVHVYSVTKPLAALALLRLVDRGQVALDAPVADYWPEFAQAGKAGMPVRWLLTHQAGLLGLRAPQPAEVIFDWERVVALLAAEAPWWPPGTRHGEQAYFFGHLVGEIVRRVSGQSLGAFLRAEVTGPWALDFHVGLTDAEMARCATVVGMTDAWRTELGVSPGSFHAQVVENPPGMRDAAVINGAAWRRAEIPAVNGHATARAIARLYGGLACGGVLEGVRLLSEALLDEALTVQCDGEDVLLKCRVRWGLAFQIDDDGFGHGGLGGAFGWGNRPHRFGFGYVTNRMARHDRALAVYAAVAEVLGFSIPED